MADENHHTATTPTSSNPPPSQSPSPLSQNGNPNSTSSKSSLSDRTVTMSDQSSFRRSPRLLGNGGKCTSGKRGDKSLKKPSKAPPKKQKTSQWNDVVSFLIGDPVPDKEARRRWPWRYQEKVHFIITLVLLNNDEDEELVLDVKCHYYQAEIEKHIFDLGDCAYVKASYIMDQDLDSAKKILGMGIHRNRKARKLLYANGDLSFFFQGKVGAQNFVGKILEFFKTTDNKDYFRVQWFFRAEDTVMGDKLTTHDKKRLFYSTLTNDNLLDCIVSKVKVNSKARRIPPCDFYYNMKYSVDYSTFSALLTNNFADSYKLSSSPNMKVVHTDGTKPKFEGISSHLSYKSELALLDVYSGCGGMSTGLSLGAKVSGVDLLTKWAVEIDKSACESLKLNHPETQVCNSSLSLEVFHVPAAYRAGVVMPCLFLQVRNESAEDFLDLLKEWDKLCQRYAPRDVNTLERNSRVMRVADKDADSKTNYQIPKGEYEVASLVDICYGITSETSTRRLKFRVRWSGYSPSDDTWEAIEELSKCQDRIQEFVLKGLKAKILPRPGDVDVICGGPPCQGISGYNRFRNVDSPLEDERNHQIVVFMDIINFLKPKYVLMENVVDILRFAKGCLGRYALSRLVRMDYQARLGIMAAGCYGLPQFRLRVFLWGAHRQEASTLLLNKLPQFPLPTHDVVLKYGAPSEFERNVVAYDEGQPRDQEKAIILSDAISDLPPVTNSEILDKISFRREPETEFQKYIRATKSDMMGSASGFMEQFEESVLYDHRPLPLSEDDYLRVCRIPKRKGANFRDLPGVVVGADNVVRRTDGPTLMPSESPWVRLPSDQTFTSGKYNKRRFSLSVIVFKSFSLCYPFPLFFHEFPLRFTLNKCRPFGRLWWDETVPTLLCKPDAHSQAILHPEQDRVLTIRECARLQGFHDFFEFSGDVKERYSQVGNAVAIPVGRALGYALGKAVRKLCGDEPLMTLPRNFSHSTTVQLLRSLSGEN
ncbi:hypothetical protein RJ639_018409 [Escallonia herrerae]|uniref:DNA (cytosine-5-)-methyltransferase n=1 Tax=Escallonia herrerae TaxID=1293975 RepID=A0AA89AJV4_9ASTE|nr:hypothetical protein RJ639_018409 [Escallonia herrerae]